MEREFGTISLGDKRRDARLIDSATQIADRPTASNPQRLNENDLDGFYRLVHGPRAQPDIIQQGHRERTRERMFTTPNRILNIHDTTELDYTGHTAIHDELGPIGTGKQRGLLQHNSIAFDPEGKQILGLIHQQLVKRQERPPGETRTERADRPIKESRLWLAGFCGVGRCPEGQRWIDVCDRGADFFEAMQESQQLGHEFLIRVVHDRRLKVTDEDTGQVVDEMQSLHATMDTIEATTTKEIVVASQGGRPARTVKLEVGYRHVRLQPPLPNGFRRGLMAMDVTLIRVWEPGVIAARSEADLARKAVDVSRKAVKAAEKKLLEIPGKKKRAAAEAQLVLLRAELAKAKAVVEEKNREVSRYLDWWLATSSPIESDADALQSVSDYEWRWPVAEEYHKAEKSGLKIESQRFESLPALMAALAIIAVVAIRLLQLRYARDEQPDAPASIVATPEEIEMVVQATQPKKGSKSRKAVASVLTMTVKQFVDGVAKLGGYLGRAGDGPPGWQSLWRGYQRLRDLLLGQALFREAHEVEVEVEPKSEPPD